MLLQFSLTNFKSFKEKAILSLVASNYDKDTREEENITVYKPHNLRLLNSAVMYGPNASGKTKFIEAFIFFKNFILNSSKGTQPSDLIPVDSFKLNAETINQASEFEIIFSVTDKIYRYGIAVDTTKVNAEWLFLVNKKSETEIFYRDNGDINYNRKLLSKGGIIVSENLIRDNALFLSVLAQFNDDLGMSLFQWFNNCNILSGLDIEGYYKSTIKLAGEKKGKQRIQDFISLADLGISNFTIDETGNSIIDNIPDLDIGLFGIAINLYRNKTSRDVFADVGTSHNQYNSDGTISKVIELSMNNDESSGTRKFFALIGQIMEVLDKGSILIVDELDSKLHPNLVCRIVEIFNSKTLNPHNAQLVFNTHDTNLLSSGLFRRDQIWFIKKNNLGASSLYSLADFKTDEVRKNEAFEPNYLRGKYGAIPFLRDFDNIVRSIENAQ